VYLRSEEIGEGMRKGMRERIRERMREGIKNKPQPKMNLMIEAARATPRSQPTLSNEG
jgi:hypothetical protein